MIFWYVKHNGTYPPMPLDIKPSQAESAEEAEEVYRLRVTLPEGVTCEVVEVESNRQYARLQKEAMEKYREDTGDNRDKAEGSSESETIKRIITGG